LYEAGPELAGDLGAYLAGLASDQQASVGDMASGRDLDLQLEPGVSLAPDRLPAIGIVVTELITNALKYGADRIAICLRRDGAEIEVVVQDGGSGFPAAFDPMQSRGLGMRVATTLARQLGGTLQVDREASGGRVVLRIPAQA
jgi:two-component sensor histidine kinase